MSADQLARALELLLAKVRRDAPDLSGKLMGDCDEALAAHRAQADSPKLVSGTSEAVACVLEWGAVSLPVGDSSRITEFEIHKDIASAIAAGRRCGFDWRVYASPHQVAQPLTDEQIEALAHRIAWRYKKSSDPHHSDTYTFNRDTLIQFARAIDAAHGIAAPTKEQTNG